MDPAAIIALATEVGKVINKVLDQLPTHDQRKMEEFYKFMDMYNQEVLRADRDTDDLVLWRMRKELLMNTVIKQLMEGKK